MSMASCWSHAAMTSLTACHCARPLPGGAPKPRRHAALQLKSSITLQCRHGDGGAANDRLTRGGSSSGDRGRTIELHLGHGGLRSGSSFRGCGVQVVSLAKGGVVWCCSGTEEAMASKRKLPKLEGTLFKYGSKSIQVAFKTGNYKQQVVFIGGLTDGFLATDYVEPLAKALEAEKWSLVQPLFTSSYTGFGTSSLKEDAIEIEQLLNYLIDQEDSEGFILVGHSTGCQDIVHYLRTGGHCTRAVRGAILQAPVSDREFRATLPETQPMLELAEKMIKEGKGEELMPRDASPEAPITANRFRSLSAYMGDDDLFSSDFSDAQLKARLGHMSRVPCQVIFSMADEYVPDHVDKVNLIKRLCEAMGGADKMAIPWGNHSLSNRVEETVRAMLSFIKKGGPKGWDDPWG
ncbi:hypothetical protein KC19_4G147700 [Ceratodon purpureus]|uniref:Uncharacterized protein n=1 Tax=Ceratodon purpureus TaxID=3225 RepID=A0A8T0I906_CERPU|nr:hypothetical protein KC19_4G147700 [Ceratodon purpureus]